MKSGEEDENWTNQNKEPFQKFYIGWFHMKTNKTRGERLTDLVATGRLSIRIDENKNFLERFWKNMVRSPGGKVWNLE